MDYFHSTKPRVTLLFLLLAAATVTLAAPDGVALVLMKVLPGLALTVAGAGALNNYLERERDRLMSRTSGRPLPAGRLSPPRVFAGGSFLLILGLTELAWLAGLLTASLAAAGAAYYIFVYTLILKRRSAHGVVPGGLAGLFPPLVAWSATGVPADRLLLFICAFVFLWSPPHFWALALAKGDDYRRAGFPTLRDTRGEAEARLHILLYVTGLLSLSFLPLLDGMAGPRYLVGALAAAALLSIGAASLFRGRPQRGAWLVYKLSGPYLALILAAMVLDRLAGEPATVALW